MSRRAARQPRRGLADAALNGVVAVMLIVAVGCSSTDEDAGNGTEASSGSVGDAGQTWRVPEDVATIQDAVDGASEGDLILVGAGTWNESVTVETPRLTIRGVDRNTVVLDGEDRAENGIAVFSDGVSIENLTVHGYRGNGVFFSGSYDEGEPLRGFAARYVTAYDNGLYGIYAFGARGGVIEKTYTAGHPDAGLYVGQCYPCETVLRDNVAERNQNGFQGANAGGDLYVISSVFRANRVGVQTQSSTRERLYPQREAVVMANLVTDNNGDAAPASADAYGAGIIVAGGRGNRIERNVVTAHDVVGILITEIDDFLAESNTVRDNSVTDNAVDLAYVNGSGATLANCFGGNLFGASSPPDIQVALNCAPETTGGSGEIAFSDPPPDSSPGDGSPPPPQPTMDDAETRGPSTAPSDPPELDEAALVVPTQ